MRLRGADDPRAPWNDVEAYFRTCPHCEGQKGEYWDAEGGLSLTPKQYNKLKDEEKQQWFFEPCCMCDGLGEIEEDLRTDDVEPDKYD